METNEIKEGQIVTIAIDVETHYRVMAIEGNIVDLVRVSDNVTLKRVSCVELTFVSDI
jgi:hypothetical protein